MKRRPPRRPHRQARPHHRVPPALRRANELMDAGNYAEAALAFEKIARRADARRGSRAPIFYLRAGRAYILNEDVEQGMGHLRKGFTKMAKKQHWEPLHRFGQRAISELKELGYEKEAQEIADYLGRALPEKPPTEKAESRPQLPTQCPSCGAPIRSDEVAWLDQKTAECVLCGNPVRGED